MFPVVRSEARTLAFSSRACWHLRDARVAEALLSSRQAGVNRRQRVTSDTWPDSLGTLQLTPTFMSRYIPLLALTLVTAVSTSVAAQGAMRVAPSGRGTSEVTLTLVDSVARAASKPAKIKIDYGQPNLRGRRLLTDSLVPYDKAWRLGANGATKLTSDVDLMIGGLPVPRGTYVLQALPSRAGWKLFIQKETGQSPMQAAMTYNPANDIARIDMRPTTLPMPLETLTMWLIPSRELGAPHGQLVIAWGAVSLSTDWSMK